ncbi:MAG: hypothetical protein PHD51_03575 [Patescibacteria group bacterium]|nr:hypothetical protein [Patescibacteria group bacterium]MDD5490946.1 hypothetical protein [Patescibacteria group bacterium]
MKNLIFLVLLSAILLGGCATGVSEAYLKADTLWCHNTLLLCAELVADKYANNSNEKSGVLMYVATHECNWDIEKKLSTLGNPSQSCKCAFAADETERIIECDEWLEKIRKKGGCHEQ